MARPKNLGGRPVPPCETALATDLDVQTLILEGPQEAFLEAN